MIEPKRHTPLLKGSVKNLFFPPEQGEYAYFNQAGDNPFAPGNTIVKASWAADAAMLSYARYGNLRMDDQQLERNLALGGLTLRAEIGPNPNNWNAPGTQAFFATGSDFAVLAFRGTEVDDPADAYDDLDLLLAPEPSYKGAGAPPLGHLAMIEGLFSEPCFVHHGFQAALNQVWGQVHQQLSGYRLQNPESEICLTGHSLGAALALLTYARFTDPNMSAYTIGCPRVGDGAFARRVASNPGKGHFRFVNCDDLVTHVPLESALYRHAPQLCYRFDDTGQLDTENDGALTGDIAVLGETIAGLPADFRTNLQELDQLPAPPGVVDHSPARYCMRLWDCV